MSERGMHLSHLRLAGSNNWYEKHTRTWIQYCRVYILAEHGASWLDENDGGVWGVLNMTDGDRVIMLGSTEHYCAHLPVHVYMCTTLQHLKRVFSRNECPPLFGGIDVGGMYVLYTVYFIQNTSSELQYHLEMRTTIRPATNLLFCLSSRNGRALFYAGQKKLRTVQ